jgi:hypothetical protein
MKKTIINIFLGLLMLTMISSPALNVNVSDNQDSILFLIRVDLSKNNEILPTDLDIVGYTPGEWIDIIVTGEELLELSNMDLMFEVIINDVIAYDDSVRGQYHTFPEIESILDEMANDHPDITDLYSLGTTYEGRDIWCLEITDNPGVDEGEPGIFFMGLHHAREWPTVEITLHLCDELTSNYQSIIEDFRIWVIPCLNPDGYVYCHDLGHDWRKNRRPVDGGIGIDLNRNYAGSSDGNPWGAWGSVGTGSISNHPTSELYCGPSPFSEIETQVVRDIFLENDIFASITWHTHGELVLIPWAYNYDDPPDDPYVTYVGQQIAAQITRQSGSGTYTPQQGAVLYPTTGDTVDWGYGYAHYVLGRPTFVYTIEACNTFHPPESVLDQVVAENFDGALALLEEVEEIYSNVDRRVIPPIIEEMEEPDIDGDYTISWEEQNPEADASKFQLDELIGPNFHVDDAETVNDYWDINGFSLSTFRSHSSSHSYKSGSGNEKVYSMTSIDPIPVTNGMELDFWCWYKLESKYDMTFVEVSKNGRSFDILDSLTGVSSNWEHKQYSLDEYAGESIIIRFRYITDQGTLEEGIYLDDIKPVVTWNSISTLSDTITQNSYDIIGKLDGTNYYRVRGYNSGYEWGDFSCLENITVEIFNNDPPAPPTINGPTSGVPGTSYDYSISSVDPDGDEVYYWIEWFEGCPGIFWQGPYAAGEEVEFSHTWDERGDYTISVTAKDVFNATSDTTTLKVTIPRNRTTQSRSIIYLFEHFPIIRQILALMG